MKASKVMSIIALVWFCLLFIGVANSSYYSCAEVITWSVLAILYGIAFAIVVLVQSCKQGKKERDIKQPESRMSRITQCPYCGEEIADAAKKCKHCGEWLDRADEQVK
jgi:hypothetical protein